MYDSRAVYLPDVGQLEAGDILLTRSAYGSSRKGGVQARAIRMGSGGAFDHAAICTSPPAFAEAGSLGVSILSLARVFANDLDNVRLLRYPDQQTAGRAASIAQYQVGRPYSKGRAIFSVLPGVFPEHIEDRGIFCSALVALAFHEAGAPAFRALQPEKVTPATLAGLPGLTDLTAPIFAKRLAPANLEMMSALDGDRVESPSNRQTEIAFAYAAELLPMTDAIATSFPELGLTPPQTFYGVIEFLMNAFDKLVVIPEDRRVSLTAMLQHLDTRAAELLQAGDLAGVSKEMRDLEATSTQELIAKSFDPRPDIDPDHLAQVLAAREKSLPVRRAAQQSFAQHAAVLASVAAWLAIESETIAALEANMRAQAEVLARLQGSRKF